MRLLVVVWMVVGCGRENARENARENTIAPLRDPVTQTAASSAPSAAASACGGLAPIACAEQPGCILDQPAPGTYACRPAADECERAARHADVIGPGSQLASVTTATHAAAVAACRAVPGCVATEGVCSCPCAVLGRCDCECGGHYLARCARAADAKRLEGVPGK